MEFNLKAVRSELISADSENRHGVVAAGNATAQLEYQGRSTSGVNIQ